MKARVLIAARQAPNRAALRLLLQERYVSVVVGEAADSAELLAQLAAQQPTVVLLEWDLPGQSTEDLLPAVRGLDHRLEVIVLSGRPELEPRARAAGADAFVSLCDPPQRLLAALQALQGGRKA
jgi:DNA-binding NarL/FixJ family response regulator